jgi:hypothetical protein
MNLNLSFAGHEIAWNDLPDSSKAALASLGFSTKIKNSIAGVKAGILGTAKEPWTEEQCEEAAAEYGLVTLYAENGRGDAFANAVISAIQSEMFDAIVKGIEPSGRRGGKRLSDDEKLRRSIAVEMLDNLAKKQGKALPKRSKPDEKEAFENYLSKALGNEKFAAAVDKEFNDRKRKADKVAFDLDDLV